MSTNEIISAYMQAKQEKTDAEKREKYFRALLIENAAGREFIETETYNVIFRTTESIRIDTDALQADFPTIKKDYPKIVKSVTIIATEKKSSAGKKSA